MILSFPYSNLNSGGDSGVTPGINSLLGTVTFYNYFFLKLCLNLFWVFLNELDKNIIIQLYLTYKATITFCYV